jgi:hypothetical protein
MRMVQELCVSDGPLLSDEGSQYQQQPITQSPLQQQSPPQQQDGPDDTSLENATHAFMTQPAMQITSLDLSDIDSLIE